MATAAARRILIGLMGDLPSESHSSVVKSGETAASHAPRCNAYSTSALRCRLRRGHWSILTTVEVALIDDCQMIGDLALHAIARTVDDVIADPHCRRSAAIEIDRPTGFETLVHEYCELGQCHPWYSSAPAVGHNKVNRLAIS